MTQQTHPTPDEERFADSNQVSDPITGSRILAEQRGPVTGETSSRTWGIAARWIAFSILLILAILVLFWISGDRM